jgi:hypothetical protein
MLAGRVAAAQFRLSRRVVVGGAGLGRSAVGGGNEEPGRPLFFGALLAEELGPIEPQKSKVTRLQSDVH